MSERFKYYSSSQVIKDNKTGQRYYGNKPLAELLNELYEDNQMLDRLIEKRDGWNNLAHERIFELEIENKRLKTQLYCNDEEGVCNICKHHYLVKDDESELGYYNSRCKKGHYECARVSLKYCEDFEKELKE